jgi:hypothetical protein
MYSHLVAHALKEISPALSKAAQETERIIFQEIIPECKALFRHTRLPGELDEEAAYHSRCPRRIILTASYVFLLGCVLLPAAVPWFAMLFRGFSPAIAFWRMLLGLMFSWLPLSLRYAFVGFASGCLFAPARFLEGPAGVRWMNMVGAGSVPGARIVCTLMILIGFLVMAGVPALQGLC